MADPSNLDPGLLAKWAAALLAIGAVFSAPFKVFMTKKAADKTYLKRIEDDGTFHYVSPQEFNDLSQKIERATEATLASNEESAKLRQLCRDWMKQP